METNGRDLSGKFINGHQGFKKGMPEYQRQTRAALWDFFQDKIKKLPEIFEKMSPNNQAKILLEVGQFFAAKQREILADVEVETRGASIDYTKLSEQAFKEVLNLTTIHKNGTEI